MPDPENFPDALRVEILLMKGATASLHAETYNLARLLVFCCPSEKTLMLGFRRDLVSGCRCAVRLGLNGM